MTRGTIKSNTVTVKNNIYEDVKYNYRTIVEVTDSNGKELKNKTDYLVYYQIKEDGKWITLSKSAIFENSRLKLTAANPVAEMRVKIVGIGEYEGNANVYKTFTISR